VILSGTESIKTVSTCLVVRSTTQVLISQENFSALGTCLVVRSTGPMLGFTERIRVCLVPSLHYRVTKVRLMRGERSLQCCLLATFKTVAPSV